MINDETKRKLRELNLSEMISGLDFQQSEPATVALTFDERFQRLIDYVYQEKHNGKIHRLIKSARLRFPQADQRSIIYDGRTLDKHLMDELFTCDYIRNNQSVVFQGPTGSGKTFLGCALAKKACQEQVRTRYIRMPDLLMEYDEVAILSGQPQKILRKYASYPLLVLDEWLVSEISDAELYFLFELMERRSDSTSTIFCTQYRKDDWVTRMGSGIQAEAVCDRYAYTAYWIETGDSNMREYCAKHHI